MTYTRLAQRAMALACFLAPMLFLIHFIVHALALAPHYFMAPPKLVQASEHQLYSEFIGYWSAVLLIPAFFGLTYVVGQRVPRLAIVCAVMGLVGMVVLVCGSYLNVNVAIATQAGRPMEWDFFLNLGGPSPLQLIMGLPILLYFIANIILGIGVLRTGALPRWSGALLIAAGFLMFDWTGPQLSGVPLITGSLAAICLVIVYALVGARLWLGQGEAQAAEVRRAVA
jgi:hypothetical protein